MIFVALFTFKHFVARNITGGLKSCANNLEICKKEGNEGMLVHVVWTYDKIYDTTVVQFLVFY